MLWEVNEHELSDFGMQKKTLEVSPECSEVEFYAQCIDYERELAESCQYDPEFIVRIDELCENYTLDELQQMKSVYSEDLFSAQNDLLTFMSVNSGELSLEQHAEFEQCLKKIEEAIMVNTMLENAIGEEMKEEIKDE